MQMRTTTQLFAFPQYWSRTTGAVTLVNSSRITWTNYQLSGNINIITLERYTLMLAMFHTWTATELHVRLQQHKQHNLSMWHVSPISVIIQNHLLLQPALYLIHICIFSASICKLFHCATVFFPGSFAVHLHWKYQVKKKSWPQRDLEIKALLLP